MADEPAVQEPHERELEAWQERDALQRAVKHGVVSGFVAGMFNLSYQGWFHPDRLGGIEAILGFVAVGLGVGLYSYRKRRQLLKRGIDPDSSE